MASETKTVSTLNITFQDEFNQLDYTYKIDNPKPNLDLTTIQDAYDNVLNSLLYTKANKKLVAIYSAQYVTTTTTKTDVE